MIGVHVVGWSILTLDELTLLEVADVGVYFRNSGIADLFGQCEPRLVFEVCAQQSFLLCFLLDQLAGQALRQAIARINAEKAHIWILFGNVFQSSIVFSDPRCLDNHTLSFLNLRNRVFVQIVYEFFPSR